MDSRDTTTPFISAAVLNSVRLYHQNQRWYCHLFLLMPDHLHALLAFHRGDAMSTVIKAWKSFHARVNALAWQDGYFDHRIRDDHEFELKASYIRNNPVAKGLCRRPEDWLWVVDGGQLDCDEELFWPAEGPAGPPGD